MRLKVDGDRPERILSPAEFLPAAERSGLIRTIDRWMTFRGLDLAERLGRLGCVIASTTSAPATARSRICAGCR